MAIVKLRTPITREDACRLRLGDIVYVTGTFVTARDAAHKRMIQYLEEGRKMPFTFEGLTLFHCGPLVKKVDSQWNVLAAGPTTSMRMEPFENRVIQELGVRLIVGKGGMGDKTREALKKFGAAYGVFTGGAAVLAAKRIKKVKDVKWLDLGVPDAVWTFEVDCFGPVIIGMDAHGNSLFRKVQAEALKNKAEIISGFMR